MADFRIPIDGISGPFYRVYTRKKILSERGMMFLSLFIVSMLSLFFIILFWHCHVSSSIQKVILSTNLVKLVSVEGQRVIIEPSAGYYYDDVQFEISNLVKSYIFYHLDFISILFSYEIINYSNNNDLDTRYSTSRTPIYQGRSSGRRIIR